jgi:Protein of unknown function (DUF3224)
MTSHAEGTFTVKAWDESPFQELADGTKLTKAKMTFDFGGDVTAEGVSDTVMYYRADGTAVYTGLQRMVGAVAGRDGSFVLQADGEFAAGEARTRWQIIEGSGTGDLAGLRGSGLAVAASSPGGSFSLDYDLA